MPALRRRSALLAALLLACGLGSPSPQRVTRDFWAALQAGDPDAARAQATADSAHRIEGLRQGRPIEEVLLGETLVGENSASVRTSLATSANGSPFQTSFDTHLVRERGQWRVDVAATERALTAAVFADSVDLLGRVVGEGVQEFGAALEDGVAEISRAVREALEDLQQRQARDRQ